MLKKVVFAVIISLSLVFVCVFVWNINSLKSISSNRQLNENLFFQEYETYQRDNSSMGKIVINDEASKNSFTFLKMKEKLYTTGGSFSLDRSLNVDQVMNGVLSELQIRQEYSEKTQYGESIYGFSPRIKFRKVVNGKVVNVQIFKNSQKLVVGVPIIFGSY